MHVALFFCITLYNLHTSSSWRRQLNLNPVVDVFLILNEWVWQVGRKQRRETINRQVQAVVNVILLSWYHRHVFILHCNSRQSHIHFSSTIILQSKQYWQCALIYVTEQKRFQNCPRNNEGSCSDGSFELQLTKPETVKLWTTASLAVTYCPQQAFQVVALRIDGQIVT